MFTGLYLLPLTFGEPVVFKEVKLEPGTEQTLGNITRVTMNKAFEPTQQQAPEEEEDHQVAHSDHSEEEEDHQVAHSDHSEEEEDHQVSSE